MALPSVELNEIYTDDGEDDGLAHLISKSDWGKAYVMGEAVLALCGKLWVPSRDPQNLPVCERCKRALKQIYGIDFSG